MKKILLLFGIIALTATAFWGCEKEKNEQTTDCQTCSGTEDTDWDEYVCSLSNQTGIDLQKISSYEVTSRITNITRNIIHINSLEESKGALTEAKYWKIKNLYQRIQTADNKDALDSVLILYDSLCHICASINGFVFTTNADGFQEVLVEGDQIIASYPIEEMNEQESNMNKLINQVARDFPSFDTLSENQKIEVLTSAIYLRSMDNKDLSENDCIKKAKSRLVWRLSLNTAIYVAAAGICIGTTIFTFACEAAAYAAYIDTCADAIRDYNTALKLCN